jgi:hypothetical protein
LGNLLISHDVWVIDTPYLSHFLVVTPLLKHLGIECQTSYRRQPI